MLSTLKEMLSLVPLTLDNVNSQKWRYMEYFSGYGFNEGNNSTLNDIAKEFEHLVENTINYAV